jgi:glycosyltransferase involved in cell wall biosynthesis
MYLGALTLNHADCNNPPRAEPTLAASAVTDFDIPSIYLPHLGRDCLHSLRHMNTGVSAPFAIDREPTVAVIIPCYNEAGAIAKVVRDFRSALPKAKVFVYDNASSDMTSTEAKAAGAIVCNEVQRGKGHVVRRMFADVDADVFVMVDGDDTYDASIAPLMVELLLENSLDMVNAARVAESTNVYRAGHQVGNAMLSGLVAKVFGSRITDMLSGYRAFSRRFVKSFPAVSSGFEIETELTVHALELCLPVVEIPVRYKERARGTQSKLNTYRDGILIFKFIVHLIKQERPFEFFGAAFLALALTSVLIEIPVIVTFVQTSLVPQIPSAVLGVGVGLLSFLSLVCGLILETVTQGRIEAKRMHYLSLPPPRLNHAPFEVVTRRVSANQALTAD